MYIFFAAVIFAIVSDLGSNTTFEVTFGGSESCEICSSCMEDIGFLDTTSEPTFGTTRACVDYCVDCYSGSKDSISCTTDTLTVDGYSCKYCSY